MPIENNPETSLVPVGTMQLTAPTAIAQDIEATATNPDHMAEAQHNLIDWCEAKLAEVTQERDEAQEACDYAKGHKWRWQPLERVAQKSQKRVDYYGKVLAALQNGFVIVPNFPVTAFAIRTGRKNPLRMWTTSYNQKHTQASEGLPLGQGEYKNPFPLVLENTLAKPTATEAERKQFWADSWKELEFPISMAKPVIMKAATRAAALKIFDDLAILPGYAPSEGTRPPKGDPMIVGRIYDTSRPIQVWQRDGWNKTVPSKHVTFMVAWHLNTRDL